MGGKIQLYQSFKTSSEMNSYERFLLKIRIWRKAYVAKQLTKGEKRMEVNRIEIEHVQVVANDAAEGAVRELADLQLLAVGGGCITANFS